MHLKWSVSSRNRCSCFEKWWARQAALFRSHLSSPRRAMGSVWFRVHAIWRLRGMFWFDNPRCRKSTTFDVLHAFVQPQEVLKGSRKSIPGSQIEEGVGQAWSGITEFELEGTVMFDLWMLFRQEGGDPGRFPKRCQGWGRCARSRKLILCCSPLSGPEDWINFTSNRKNVCIMLVCVF